MSGMKLIYIYVGCVVALAVAVLVSQDWHIVARMPLDAKLGLCALVLLSLVAESLTLSITVGKTPGSTSSIVFLPLLTSIILFGPAPSTLLIGVSGAVGEFLFRKKTGLRAVFNVSQYVASAGIAGALFTTLGGVPIGLEDPQGETLVGVGSYLNQGIAFISYGLCFLLLNHIFVAGAISISERQRFLTIWARLSGKTGTNLLYDLLISPVAILAAAIFLAIGFWSLPLIVLPLLFIRKAYQTILDLQQANRDLLRALVKAIETRDPYTSGHSLRVMHLASRIAEAMNLSPNRQKNIEQAALLHDIGKIESTYANILAKPAELTSQERAVIESHVIKGVELLEQLVSFPREVINGVRSHHERFDGEGYPDKLSGDAIPIAGRIIKVCDAIDAMLSDRPYRKALTLEQVKDQLRRHAGTQFDPAIVKIVIDQNLIEAHYADMWLRTANSGNDLPVEAVAVPGTS